MILNILEQYNTVYLIFFAEAGIFPSDIASTQNSMRHTQGRLLVEFQLIAMAMPNVNVNSVEVFGLVNSKCNDDVHSNGNKNTIHYHLKS